MFCYFPHTRSRLDRLKRFCLGNGNGGTITQPRQIPARVRPSELAQRQRRLAVTTDPTFRTDAAFLRRPLTSACFGALDIVPSLP